MGDVRVETIAYAKFILHAAKYPHCAVNGLLIAENKGWADDNELVIIDAVPLFHHSHNLAPMAEIALTKVDLDTQENKRMIVGYYAACENFNDKTPEKCPSPKIAEKVLEFFSQAVFLVIENGSFLPPQLTHSGVKGYRFSDNKWKPMESKKLTLASSNDGLYSMLSGFDAIKNLVDFDNYLDDLTLDWTNSDIEKMINNVDANKCEPRKEIKQNNVYEDEDEDDEDDEEEEETSQDSSE